MFQSLLTPLRSRFDLSPRTSNAELPPNSPNTNAFSPQSPFSIMSPGMKTPTMFGLPNSAPQDDDLEPEEFARDVLVELMRTVVDGLKEVQLPQEERGKSRREVRNYAFFSGVSDSLQILTEILHIMGQDPCTKDVFREMDGFLGIMSVLSTTDASFSATLTPETPTSPISDSGPTPFLVVRKDDPSQDAVDVLRLVFQILSEATKHHETNARYFSVRMTTASIRTCNSSPSLGNCPLCFYRTRVAGNYRNHRSRRRERREANIDGSYPLFPPCILSRRLCTAYNRLFSSSWKIIDA